MLIQFNKTSNTTLVIHEKHIETLPRCHKTDKFCVNKIKFKHGFDKDKEVNHISLFTSARTIVLYFSLLV